MVSTDNVAEESGPLRTCIATRTVRPAAAMLRFVLDPQGQVVPDLRRRLPGRGVWVTATAAAVREAQRRNAFGRAFKRPAGATAAASLADDVDRLMERDALQWLAFANKAGGVAAGAAKAESAIRGGATLALIHASEAKPDGVRKLESALARAMGETARTVPRVNIFSGDQLDLALGRSNVIHAALSGGGAGREFLVRCWRLEFYRTGKANDSRRQSTSDGTGTVSAA